MQEQLSVSGLVATTPRHLVTAEGLPITTFRFVNSTKRFDRMRNEWLDGESNWYTVVAFRQLAVNISQSVGKGDRLLVTGALKVNDWDRAASIEIEADSVGHDLAWGKSVYTRNVLVRDVVEPDPTTYEF